MKTDCNGSSDGESIENAFTYFRDRWNIGWDFEEDANFLDYDELKEIIKGDQPFIFSAVGQWFAAVSQEADYSHIPLKGVLGASGHSTVAYGYDDGPRSFLVCLGWGSAFFNTWVVFDQFNSHIINFVDNF